MQYPVNEIFETVQGEGHFTGYPVIFIRLQGCDVGCSWCDTKQTWTVDPEMQVSQQAVNKACDDKPHWANFTAQEFIAMIQKNGFVAKHIVISGGEPCQYDLVELTGELEQAGYFCQIETSGTSEVRATDTTWVTVSPKIQMKGQLPVLQSALRRANEIKHVIAMEKHIEELDELIANIDTEDKIMCLQPISQQKRATDLAIKLCIERNWKLSVQMHKYIFID
ncbi:7-carboxy-7-deazaguanine synthase QueE [Moritella viscosa]|uniref:7-carboxy-7-deazaguanine synthase n=1 Tax=Moritella viscosa TaxID=80854 RepID=A0A090IE46_9GAMM|nr:7-carboxy-7-deazaguanine synthase QueE [Moritella viscosa]CED60321.1 radical SAM superfamily protein [Moritella viscosa]SGY98203.1 Radical activating enzyme [Moritella viscosa]SGZ05045.1 Radical activating enzyme [Moritella viscosa]SGZ05311.1 Radical activating enzyme [Moritella viscosa]SGZ12018.1 Radical activating enzyme [Moritella viscosa]